MYKFSTLVSQEAGYSHRENSECAVMFTTSFGILKICLNIIIYHCAVLVIYGNNTMIFSIMPFILSIYVVDYLVELFTTHRATDIITEVFNFTMLSISLQKYCTNITVQFPLIIQSSQFTGAADDRVIHRLQSYSSLYKTLCNYTASHHNYRTTYFIIQLSVSLYSLLLIITEQLQLDRKVRVLLIQYVYIHTQIYCVDRNFYNY